MTSLKERFSTLFNYFDLDNDSKIEKFQETLEETLKFSEQLKESIVNGTDEERLQIQEFMGEMQEKIENEKNKLFEKMGLSEEELKEFINDSKNFSEEEWKAMQEMKKYLKDTLDPKGNTIRKQKRKSSKTKWIQS